jgi:hypothetical protein
VKYVAAASISELMVLYVYIDNCTGRLKIDNATSHSLTARTGLFPCCRIPVVICHYLAGVAVYADHAHDYKIERIENGEHRHHPDANEFRANSPGNE